MISAASRHLTFNPHVVRPSITRTSPRGSGRPLRPDISDAIGTRSLWSRVTVGVGGPTEPIHSRAVLPMELDVIFGTELGVGGGVLIWIDPIGGAQRSLWGFTPAGVERPRASRSTRGESISPRPIPRPGPAYQWACSTVDGRSRSVQPPASPPHRVSSTTFGAWYRSEDDVLH